MYHISLRKLADKKKNNNNKKKKQTDLPQPRTNYLKNSFSYSGARL